MGVFQGVRNRCQAPEDDSSGGFYFVFSCERRRSKNKGKEKALDIRVVAIYSKDMRLCLQTAYYVEMESFPFLLFVDPYYNKLIITLR